MRDWSLMDYCSVRFTSIPYTICRFRKIEERLVFIDIL